MTNFSDLGLSEGLLAAVTGAGYTTPTPIQAKAIPLALAGRDVLGIAQTGTGKTASFALPLIDRLTAGRSKARMPRALVLTPTRELAAQVAEAFAVYGKGAKLSAALLIGGVGMADQIAALARGVDVLIATPGRLLDLFERGNILLSGVQFVVVDEADRMLDMGFIPDIERIFKLTPPSRQTLFFSATMPPEITKLTEAFLKSPERIEVARPATTADTIQQLIAKIRRSDGKMKRAALRHLIDTAEGLKNGIVFCNRKTDVDIVAKSLAKHGLNAAPIHGDLDQALRTRTLDRFRSGELTLLVASDVAARGLDIPDVSHVFNYDVPFHADDYVHRIGRTGRAGRSGVAVTLAGPADDKTLAAVLKLVKKEIEVVTLDIEAPEPGERRFEGRERPRRGRAGAPARERASDPPSEQGAESRSSSERGARPRRRRAAGEGAGIEGAPVKKPPAGEPGAKRSTPKRQAPARAARTLRDAAPEKPGAPHTSRSPAPARAPEREAPRDGVRGFGADVPAFLRQKIDLGGA